MNVQPITPRDNAAYDHPQKQEVKQALLKIRIIADAIREAGDTGIPSGHLYAAVIEKYSLQEYESIITILVRAELIDEKYHLLKWIGPKL